MKTKKWNQQGIYRRKSNNRWKWMVGATAATAAGVTASSASATTIQLLNNYISATGGDHLNADFFGDGHADVTITGASFVHNLRYIGSTPFFSDHAKAFFNGVLASAWNYGDGGPIGERLGSKVYDVRYAYQPATLNGKVIIWFRDVHINHGQLTRGVLDITVFGFSPTVQLDSITFNTPDEGSSLALLAMGAGGVLALRRWRARQRGA